MPTALQGALKGLENNSNPWNAGAAAREDWVGDLPVPKLRDKGQAEYLLFVGCAGSFDERDPAVKKMLAVEPFGFSLAQLRETGWPQDLMEAEKERADATVKGTQSRYGFAVLEDGRARLELRR